VFHANIVVSLGLQGAPSPDKGVVDYMHWGLLGYLINGYHFSLHDIQHGILRGNRKASRRKIKSTVSTHDPRIQFIPKFDQRVHFAMISGVRAFPAVGVWSSKTIEKDLQTAMTGFLREEVTYDKPKKTVFLPKIFYYYNKDFGKNDTDTIKWIISNLADPMKEELQQMIKHKLTIKFNKFDWDIHNASSEDVDPAIEFPSDQEYQPSNSDSHLPL